jgi:potassium-transporting ATPase KdpC subunit
MKKDLINSVLVAVLLTILLGLIYPLAVTAISHACLQVKATGQLITIEGQIVGSRIIGQPFTGPRYFHSRLSAAGSGYDAGASGGSNLGPTNSQLIKRINDASEREHLPVPVDLVTTSGSGLDPDITPAAAYFQVDRVIRERGVSREQIKNLVDAHVQNRQLGILGEPRVNVLQLNLALDLLAKR